MRYIPQSRYSFEEICKQCSDAINRPVESKPVAPPVEYGQVLQFYRRDYALRVA
jgi:hypothetical protein